jgi:hypothetical protein
MTLPKAGKTIPRKLPSEVPSKQKFEVKYPKPKVLLMDVPAEADDALRTLGFAVTSGSFGKPYLVPKSDRFEPVIVKASFPNFKEQEIIVVDLSYSEPDDGPQGEKHRPMGSNDIWSDCTFGIIDPRPRAMWPVKEGFDRILENGGVFIVFAEDKHERLMHHGTAPYQNFNSEGTLEVNNWSFLTALLELNSAADHGEEMKTVDSGSDLIALLGKHLAGGHFSFTIEAKYDFEKQWAILAENKFGAAVAAGRLAEGEGLVLLVPQIADKRGFLIKLFTEILPDLAPKLFPHVERGMWTHRPEYELPRILKLKEKQADVERRAKERINELETELTNERAANGWLQDLLTGTDDCLVEAVKRALAVLGFKQVRDIDEERDREGKSRREDLQVLDQSPTLVVDVKGIGGFPSDEDALQAEKHAAIRMREEKRTDIVGLSIINHQRHMPPLERENRMPFRQELLDVAEQQTLGLMTAWDLYRLVRNCGKLKWRVEDVKSLFYKKGRVGVVPEHYQFIGTIAKAWTDKFGVVIAEGELKVGDRVAIEFPIEFEEVEIGSIQVDDRKVERATVGDRTGLLWPAGMPKLREGIRVFRIPTAS